MRNFLYKLKMGFQRFMAGRYGSDPLNMGLLVISILLELVFTFTHWLPLALLSTVFLVICVIRMLSKNISKRYEENRKVMKLIERLKMRKDYHIYRCKNCGQRIRVPRKGGKRVEIRCPKCGTTFVKKI